MTLRQLNIQQLHALQLLFQTRCVSTAAHRCHMTQPAMSLNLKKLRDIFDDPLLISVGNTLQLTAFAEALWPKLDQLLIAIHNLAPKAHVFDPKKGKRTFVIALPEFYEYLVLDKLIGFTQSVNPKIQFEMRHQGIVASLEDLEKNLVDIAICLISVDQKLSAGITTVTIEEGEFYCCVKKNGALDQKAFTLKHYTQAQHIALSNQYAASAAIINTALEKLGKSRTVVGTFSSLIAALHAQQQCTDIVISGPLPVFRFGEQYFPIRYYPLPFATAPWKIVLAWNSKHDYDVSISWLAQILKKCLVL